MIQANREDRCSGCGACSNACPKHCISMVERKDGFRYPVVNKDECIDCGLCEKVCPYIATSVKGDILKQPIAYFTRSKSDEVLGTSASGGLFYELAHFVMKEGGVVFGAVWGEKYDEVYHRSICSMVELPLLQGSKYLQSDVRQCYSEAKKLLLQGRLVLFSGTPCQIAGLLSFLGDKDYDNLLTVDLICHGVPSSLATRRFVQEKEKKANKKVVRFFRDKRYGWKPPVFRLVYEDDTHESVEYAENYPSALFSPKNAIQRNSCYACKFERYPRMADISLGDYFVQKNALDISGKVVEASKDNKGDSLITVNTVQGAKFFEQIKPNISYTQLQLHTVTAWHLFFSPGSAADPENRRMFYYLYNKGLSVEKIYRIMYDEKEKHLLKYYKIRKRLHM